MGLLSLIVDNYPEEIMESSQIWPQCLEFISQRVTERSFQTWFKPTQCLSFGTDGITIEVPSHFFAEWLEQHYLPLIEESISSVAKISVPITFSVNSEGPHSPILGVGRRKVIFHRQTKGELDLNPRYTFDTFVVGESNQFAHAASLAVAEAPGKTKFNPLFIYGGVGLGKTHLIQAIGHFIRSNRPKAKVEYVTSEKFTIDFISSIGNKTIAQFSKKYRDLEVLLVDDIQFFSGKERTQSEFFHTFNTLYQRERQIVLTSDRPPREINGLEDRLLSRFSGGLVTDIQPPDLETRIAILEKRAEEDGINISEEIIYFIANHITMNIRELQGSLIRLLAYSSITGSEVSLELAQEILRDTINHTHKTLSIDQIQAQVAEEFNIPEKLLIAKKRSKEVAFPRQVAMYLCRQLTSHSLKTIGLKFGGRDHTTVIHACKLIEKLMGKDENFRDRLNGLKARIGE